MSTRQPCVAGVYLIKHRIHFMFWLITVQIVLTFLPRAERLDVIAKNNNKEKLLWLLSEYASLGWESKLGLALGLLKESAGLRHGLALRLGFTFWFKWRFVLEGGSRPRAQWGCSSRDEAEPSPGQRARVLAPPGGLCFARAVFQPWGKRLL